MMLLIRSRSTDRSVFVTGSRYWPSPAPRSIFSSSGGGSVPTARFCVGEHSTNFSPISDCGRTWQLASRRKSWYAGSSMASTTAALKSGVTSSESTLPTFTPATLTSSPGITKPALSKIARTL